MFVWNATMPLCLVLFSMKDLSTGPLRNDQAAATNQQHSGAVKVCVPKFAYRPAEDSQTLPETLRKFDHPREGKTGEDGFHGFPRTEALYVDCQPCVLRYGDQWKNSY